MGQLRLACDLIPLLGPTYGWLDESGYNTPSDGRGGLDPKELRFVFWANVFGSAHVAALGRDFLAAAPGWRLVDLPGGGLLYVVSESYREWWAEDRLDVLAHFRERVPGIELYRSEPSPY